MASTARIPTIATTIISSINVNPRLDARTIERIERIAFSLISFSKFLLSLAVDVNLVRPRGSVNMSVVCLDRVSVEIRAGGEDVPVRGRGGRKHQRRAVEVYLRRRWHDARETGDGRVPEHDRPIDVNGQRGPGDAGVAGGAWAAPRGDLLIDGRFRIVSVDCSGNVRVLLRLRVISLLRD